MFLIKYIFYPRNYFYINVFIFVLSLETVYREQEGLESVNTSDR